MSTKYQEMFTSLERAKDEHERLSALVNEEAVKILALEKEIISSDELIEHLSVGVLINGNLYTKENGNRGAYLNCIKHKAPTNYFSLDAEIKAK